ncbi:hypothetical protein, partial [Burkholderia cenocepacia]|uniref:hypothetical protein n=1 Tax=Burkholderia cenocepacia TaxID=95486 RepID=UPI0009D0C17E
MAPLTDPAAIAADIQRRLAPAKRDPKPRGDSGDQYLDCIPMIQCSDGLKMSVQTGPTHYCQPRNGRGPWRSV